MEFVTFLPELNSSSDRFAELFEVYESLPLLCRPESVFDTELLLTAVSGILTERNHVAIIHDAIQGTVSGRMTVLRDLRHGNSGQIYGSLRLRYDIGSKLYVNEDYYVHFYVLKFDVPCDSMQVYAELPSNLYSPEDQFFLLGYADPTPVLRVPTGHPCYEPNSEGVIRNPVEDNSTGWEGDDETMAERLESMGEEERTATMINLDMED